MQTLADLQRRFCDALRSPAPPPEELLAELVDDGHALARFSVYRNNFIVLNGDALAEMYPTVQRLIGTQAFRVLATEYVRRHPPRARTLLLYGATWKIGIVTRKRGSASRSFSQSSCSALPCTP